MGLTTMLRRTRRRQRTGTPKRSPSPAAGARSDGPVAGLLGLQRSAGNLAVRGLLDSADPAIAHGVESVPPAVEDVVAGGGGRPLDPEVSADLEGLVGADLSGVRVHDDPAAAQSAEAIDASAYATGEHVVFGPGRYAPRTDEGRALVAHEVGHVVAGRQQGGGAAPVQRQPKEGGSVKDRATLLGGVPAPRVSQFGSTTVATIYFAHDAFLMERGGFVAVQQLADQLAFMAKPMVSVDGYASAEGPEKRNEELGRMRREAIIAVLTSKAHGVAIGGSGHGASQPAVPETAKDPAELEGQRAQNRRATIVIMDMTSPPPPPSGGGGGRPPGPGPFPPFPPKEETEQEAADRRLKDMLKLPVDLTPPKKSLSEQAAKLFDEQADRILSDFHVPKEWRGRIKDAARSAAEKGVDAALDSALDAAHVTGQSKDAVKSALKAAAQTKF